MMLLDSQRHARLESRHLVDQLPDSEGGVVLTLVRVLEHFVKPLKLVTTLITENGQPLAIPAK